VRLCDGPSFLSAWDEIFVNRIYEIPVAAGHVPTLVDAGANIGLAALFWKWLYGEMNYIGFEPDPTVASCCRGNLRSWGVRGELIEAALGASEGTGTFVADGADGGHLVAEGEGRRVAMRRLSRLLPERVDLLKIDVEGAEADVLADVAPCLGRVRSLFVEWHAHAGRGGLGAAIGVLEAAGFDCYVQVANGPAQPFLGDRSASPYVQNLNLYAVRP
jgi:FkbM family methyltransferase